MYTLIVDIHSILRYVVLILLIILIIRSISGTIAKKDFNPGNRKLALITMISFHFQLLLGIILYFTSPKVIFDTMTMKSTMLRFFALEHPLLMIIAIILITIGYLKAKKRNTSSSHRVLMIFGIIAFVLLIIGIPWPFREALGGSWI
jgi:hypothetical protein